MLAWILAGVFALSTAVFGVAAYIFRKRESQHALEDKLAGAKAEANVGFERAKQQVSNEKLKTVQKNEADAEAKLVKLDEAHKNATPTTEDTADEIAKKLAARGY